MFSKIVALTLALTAAASAAPALGARQDACQDAYIACIAAGTPQVACGCTLAACVGEDNAGNREYCASATANLTKPTSTGIPSGCNTAHPGSCPSSYFDTTKAIPSATLISVSSIPGDCNPAQPGPCPSSYFHMTTKAPVPTITSAPSTPIAPGSNPVLVSPSKFWTVSNLTRYCGEGNTGCDYNFAVTADGNTEHCTIIRMPGSDAATESWANQKCTTGSDLTISWGYVAEPAPAFAVVTVVKNKELAWFGVANVNGAAVTPSSPFGTGQFGTLPASPLYTYN